MAITKWEYGTRIRQNRKFTDQDLNNFGNEGWQLVSITRSSISMAHTYTFKRPIMDSDLSSISHSDINEALTEAKSTIEYMNSLIDNLAVSETETYYNRYANAVNLIDSTKASL